MTEETKTRPTHAAYAVRNFKTGHGTEDASWLRIGSAWEHKDGKGFDVILEATPVNGCVVLRVAKSK